MKWRISCLVVVGLAFVFVVRQMAVQPQPAAPAFGLMYYGLMFLNTDADLHKELKLSDEQSKKIAEHAALRARVVRAWNDNKERAAALKAIDKALDETLEPAQIKRLKQIVLQQLENKMFARLALVRLPEIAGELKLTETQQMKIADGFLLADVLTAVQMTKWQALLGEKYEGQISWHGFDRPLMPASLRYATEKSVQDDLKLTAGQQEQVAELRKKWQESLLTRGHSTTDGDPKKIEELNQSTREAVLKVLKPGQTQRLQQIILQQATSGGRENALFTQPEVIAELHLTKEKQAKIQSVQEERRKELMGVFLTGENAEDIAKKVAEHKKETYQRLNAILEADQQARLTELIGEKFLGAIRPAGYPDGAGAPLLSPHFLTITGLTLAAFKPLQEELKLSEIQVKRLLQLRDRTQERILQINGDPRCTIEEQENLVRQQARENDKTLADVLEPPQLTRFKQLLLQYYASNKPTRGQSTRAIEFVEVSDGLKLTEEQKERLQSGEEMAKVLNEKQLPLWKEMLGKPFGTGTFADTRPGSGGEAPPRIPAQVLVQYLHEPSVQEDLKLKENQIQKVPELTQTWGELTRNSGNWEREEYANKMAEAQQTLEKAVAAVLDASQVARLQQIDLQQTRKHGLSAVLSTPKVQKELELTREQNAQIDRIQADHFKTQRLLTRELYRAVAGRPDEDYRKTIDAFHKGVDKQLNAVLTPRQQDTLKALLGEPFQGEIRTVPNGRPRPDGFGPPR